MKINDLKVGDVVYIREDLEFWQVYGSLIYYPKMRTGLVRVKYVSTDYFRIHQDGIGYLYTVEMIDWEKTKSLQNNNCYDFEKITQFVEDGKEKTVALTNNGKKFDVTNNDEENDIEKAVMLLMLKQRGFTYGDVKREVEKVKIKWVPQLDEKYYWINKYLEIDWYVWEGHSVDKMLFKCGNCFETRKEAEEKLDKIKEILRGE